MTNVLWTISWFLPKDLYSVPYKSTAYRCVNSSLHCYRGLLFITPNLKGNHDLTPTLLLVLLYIRGELSVTYVTYRLFHENVDSFYKQMTQLKVYSRVLVHPLPLRSLSSNIRVSLDTFTKSLTP